MNAGTHRTVIRRERTFRYVVRVSYLYVICWILGDFFNFRTYRVTWSIFIKNDFRYPNTFPTSTYDDDMYYITCICVYEYVCVYVCLGFFIYRTRIETNTLVREYENPWNLHCDINAILLATFSLLRVAAQIRSVTILTSLQWFIENIRFSFQSDERHIFVKMWTLYELIFVEI